MFDAVYVYSPLSPISHLLPGIQFCAPTLNSVVPCCMRAIECVSASEVLRKSELCVQLVVHHLQLLILQGFTKHCDNATSIVFETLNWALLSFCFPPNSQRAFYSCFVSSENTCTDRTTICALPVLGPKMLALSTFIAHVHDACLVRKVFINLLPFTSKQWNV